MSPSCSLHSYPTHVALPYSCYPSLQGRQPQRAGQAGCLGAHQGPDLHAALAASWMVALLHLLNRVQLNILGRHLYLQNNTQDSQ